MRVSLTDRLAIDRTRLANERTLLAYVRTALGLGAAGVTLWRLSPDQPSDRVVAGLAMLAGAATLSVGLYRFTREHRRYRTLTEGLEE